MSERRTLSPLPKERVLTSAARFYVGEVVQLRGDQGAWRVVELLPDVDGFKRARAVRAERKKRQRT